MVYLWYLYGADSLPSCYWFKEIYYQIIKPNIKPKKAIYKT